MDLIAAKRLFARHGFFMPSIRLQLLAVAFIGCLTLIPASTATAAHTPQSRQQVPQPPPQQIPGQVIPFTNEPLLTEANSDGEGSGDFLFLLTVAALPVLALLLNRRLKFSSWRPKARRGTKPKDRPRHQSRGPAGKRQMSRTAKRNRKS